LTDVNSETGHGSDPDVCPECGLRWYRQSPGANTAERICECANGHTWTVPADASVPWAVHPSEREPKDAFAEAGHVDVVAGEDSIGIAAARGLPPRALQPPPSG
jgi:hypothetical protein